MFCKVPKIEVEQSSPLWRCVSLSLRKIPFPFLSSLSLPFPSSLSFPLLSYFFPLPLPLPPSLFPSLYPRIQTKVYLSLSGQNEVPSPSKSWLGSRLSHKQPRGQQICQCKLSCQFGNGCRHQVDPENKMWEMFYHFSTKIVSIKGLINYLDIKVQWILGNAKWLPKDKLG